MKRETFEKLCEGDSSPFYSVDQIGSDGETYTIFSYRLASYSDWERPGALDCRGIMFRGQELVSVPPQKFFNLNENPFTEESLYRNQVVIPLVKADGSLISTYLDANGIVRAKSKTSLDSTQAILANKLLDRIRVEEPEVYGRINRVVSKYGATINFELVGPSNPIVLPYHVDKLILLNFRYPFGSSYRTFFPAQTTRGLYNSNYIDPIFVGQKILFDDFLDKFDEEEKAEGYVCVPMEDSGLPWFKIKTQWYLRLHKILFQFLKDDNILSYVVNEEIDDLIASLKSMNAAEVTVQEVEEKASKFSHGLNRIMHGVTRFHKENKSLDRKDYAIKAKSEFSDQPLLFSMAMHLFQKPDEVLQFLKVSVDKKTSVKKILDMMEAS